MKRILSLFAIVLLASSTVMAADESLFSGNELRFDTFGTYQHGNDFGAGLGVTYFATKNLGVSVWSSKNTFDNEGNFFENANAGVLFRIPVTVVLAPYVTIGSSYNIATDAFAPYAGLGAEYRITKRFGAFVEGTYGFAAWDNWSLPEARDVSVRAGLRFGF